ncbi:MAG: Asp-tRNA(Asn)/Glu-tRNA(Gln) amidotransferase subunit GatB [Methanomassiliicoccales archaeon]
MEEQLNVGLEMHIYPPTRRKMFCACSADFLGAEPNTLLCPICSGQPGSKPLPPNRECVLAGLRLAIMLGMSLSDQPVRTMRKHYFYPDLPSNYQRTSAPFATGGQLGNVHFIEIHWEEDPGQYDASKGYVDFNRSGVPLLELVTAPDMHSVDEVRNFMQDMHLLLDYLGIQRHGISMKVDTNVSVGKGERVEVKNINSSAGVLAAVKFEEKRQRALVNDGKKVVRETRHFDEITGETISLRYKETVDDYRYMNDPDILPVDINRIHVEEERNPFLILSEMLYQGVRENDARILIADRPLLEVYNALNGKADSAYISNFIVRDVRAELAYRKLPSSFCLGSTILSGLGSLATAAASGVLSNQNALLLLRELFDGRQIASSIAELSIDREAVDLEAAVRRVVSQQKDAVRRYVQGNRETLNFLVGVCMKELKGKARAQDIIPLLERVIGQSQR